MGVGGVLMKAAEFTLRIVLQGKQHLDAIRPHETVNLVQQGGFLHVDLENLFQFIIALTEAEQAYSPNRNHQ